ncbi:hypothetical protein EGW08_013237 [Elysia chlorotica]|uniref:R3H domain-containing protein n=1 Tax=Elysia chlorotica TaxID=188477 RepID=A0A433TBT6_ELYCH|nr:hypothetical protein EGW08_013237 [Elysia chlorotica]
MTTQQEEYKENILTDVNHFYEQGRDDSVLVFPPLCSFNRLLIHKTVEAHFTELATFSIGCGRSRRTVIAFLTTLDRAGTDLHRMSEQNSHHGKGRGRGRGKDLTPNERVTQWVNQRENRRLNKERWSQKGQGNIPQEDNSMEVLQETQIRDDDNEKERSRAKRTPQTKLYVPPSLRQRKEQNVSSNSHNPSTTPSEEAHQTDCSEKVSNATESKPLPTNQPKGRGRGRRKPEVEVYVPRALRATQKQDKDTLSSSLQDDGSKLTSIDQNLANSEFNQYSENSERGQNFSTVNKAEHNPINDLKDQNTREANKSDCSPVSPLVFEENVEVQTNPPEVSDASGDSEVILKSELSENLGSFESPYTFEFYDPAVVAFMPPSPAPHETDKNVNSNVYEDSHPNSSERTDSPFSLVVNECKEKHVLHHSYETQAIATKPLTISGDAFSTCLQENISIPKSLTPHDISEVNVQQKEVDSNSSHEADILDREALQSKTSEPMVTSKPQDSQNMELEPQKEKTEANTVPEDDPEDSWDTMFDDNGDCLDESLMDELIKTVGKVEVEKPRINYLKYEPKEPDMDMQALSHVVEIYDFSPDLATHDIISTFRDFAKLTFVKMLSVLVHLNLVEVLFHSVLHYDVKFAEFLQPYKARPETTSIAARRLVAGALGMAPRVSREVRDREKQKLKEAKEKRRQEKQQKIDMWDGSFGKCAMDDV